MHNNTITDKSILSFRNYLCDNEKAALTIEKYIYELRSLNSFLQRRPITKQLIVAYRQALQVQYQARTINAKLSAINAYLTFVGLSDCKVKLLKVQHHAFMEEKHELSQDEYQRLLAAAKSLKNQRLYHLLLTLCSTGIRVSELRFITIEAVRMGRVEIRSKGKNRLVLLPKDLTKKLRQYSKCQNIVTGPIFCTRSGQALDRSNICHDMKKLCQSAHVLPGKVFPHNLRHLFARSFYAIQNNLVYLADILGHSSIETTRIYVATSTKQHQHILEKMRLVM